MARVIGLTIAGVLPMALGSTETVLGVYMFHRHGDRTAKIFPPTNLTDLGYAEVYQSGTYYRSRYIEPTSPYHIQGINTDLVLLRQIQASAPIDNVLQNSATGFFQALYPPVGPQLDTEALANGTVVTSPLNGYQLIPVEIVSSGSGSEDNSWLQSSSSCYKAEVKSNEFFESNEFLTLDNKTSSFYASLDAVVKPAFNSTETTFENAYEIFDWINVGRIHNSTIPHGSEITDEVFLQLSSLANAHEWGLAYNASEPIRAVAGMTLAAQIVQYLNSTIAAAGSHSGPKMAVQFGAYASFMSFFGLANMPSVSVDFAGVCNYASAMIFELFTNASTVGSGSDFPSTDNMYIRFLFHNGTSSDASPPLVYPLFGLNQDVLSWSSFVDHMNSIALYNQSSWCTACGNTTGICSGYGSGSTGDDSSSHGSSGNGLSPAVNGVIGAMVTLGVILGVEILVIAVFGLRLASKRSRIAGSSEMTHKAESPQ